MIETEALDVFLEMAQTTWDEVTLHDLTMMLEDAAQRQMATGLPGGRPTPSEWSVSWKALPAFTERSDGQIRLAYKGTVQWEAA